MKILSAFTIAHLNIRREKAGEEEGPVACDLKLSAELKSEAVASFFSTDASRRRVLDSLWNDDGELTTTDVAKIALATGIKGGTLTLKSEFSAAETFEAADIDRVTLVPRAGWTCEVSMRAQVNPSAEQIGRLSELLGCEVHIAADRKQGELELHQPGAEDEASEAAAEETGSVVPGQPAPQRPKRSKPAQATLQ